MLTVSSLFNLYAFSAKCACRTDIKLTAVKTDLFLLIHAVWIQTEVLIQAICMFFTHVMHGTNMCRTTLLCQTDWTSLRILRRRIILQRRQSWLLCQFSSSLRMKMRLSRSRRTVMMNELTVIQSIVIEWNSSI